VKETEIPKLTPEQVVVYYLSVNSLSEAIEPEGILPIDKNMALTKAFIGTDLPRRGLRARNSVERGREEASQHDP